MLEGQLRKIALQAALEGRYLDAVIYGYVETALHLLVWVIYCVSRAVQEERRTICSFR